MQIRHTLFVFIYLVAIVPTLFTKGLHIDLGMLREGDLIFQETASQQSDALLAATGSRWTHVGMFVYHDRRPCVYEAVGPVRFAPLEEFLSGSKNGKFIVMRLRNADRILTTLNLRRLKQAALQYLGRQYDFYFRWDDRRMYCSEVLWKLFHRVLGIRIGVLRRFGSFDLNAPPVRRLILQRFGGKAPLDELVIGPGDMAASPLLRIVYAAP